MASKNAKDISDQVAQFDSLDGQFNQIGMWKVKKTLFPRAKDPPTAKKDDFGNLITAPSALRTLYLSTYKNRLEHRKMDERYKDIRQLKNELWEIRFESLKGKPSNPWIIVYLENATNNNQSRDPKNIINELFKRGIAGSSLKQALVDLMNMIHP